MKYRGDWERTAGEVAVEGEGGRGGRQRARLEDCDGMAA
jgi:hypothetical protein